MKRLRSVQQSSSTGSAFIALGLDPRRLVPALVRCGYSKPTPIQRRVIPLVLAGRDVVAMARTGSGKTAAFLAPLIQRLALRPTERVGVRGLVLTPTRELALQTFRFLTEYAKYMRIRAALLIGGESLEAQFAALAQDPEIVIATPGRLLQIMEQVPSFSLRAVEIVVLDEADRLWEGSLAAESRRIFDALQSCPLNAKATVTPLPDHQCQKVLMSATLPRELAEFTHVSLCSPAFVRLDEEKMLSSTVETNYLLCRQEEKIAALACILQTRFERRMHTLVFVATRHHAELLHRLLEGCMDFPVMYIHGRMDQSARNQTLERFRSSTGSVLFVTDVAARGLDIPLLDMVINFHFPSSPKLFVHRCGRVGRGGRRGWCWSLVSTDELPHMLDVFLFVGHEHHTMEPNLFADNDQSQVGLTAQSVQIPENVGRMPLPACLRFIEYTRKRLREDTELELLFESSLRAYKLYRKTRTKASKNSLERARYIRNQSWMQIPLHPLLCSSTQQASYPLEGQAKGIDCKSSSQLPDSAATGLLAEIHQWRPLAPICTHRCENHMGNTVTASNASSIIAKRDIIGDARKAKDAASNLHEGNRPTLLDSMDAASISRKTDTSLADQSESRTSTTAVGRKQARKVALEKERNFAVRAEPCGTSMASRVRASFLELEPVTDAVSGEKERLEMSKGLHARGTPQRGSRMQWDFRRKKFMQTTSNFGNINDPRVRRRLQQKTKRRESKSSNQKDVTPYERWIQKTKAYIQRTGEPRRPTVSALALQTVRKPDYRNKGRERAMRHGGHVPLGLHIHTEALPKSSDAVADRDVTRSIENIRKQRKQKAMRQHMGKKRAKPNAP
jgi:ATP-dependent RNA helicase DDX54/DBP10